MTTIVANAEGMAADYRVTGLGSFYPAQKIFRIRGSLIGTSGHGDACLAFVEWFKRPRRKPEELHAILGGDINLEFRDEIRILELNDTGIYHWSGWGFGERILADAYAVGSGGMPALQALRDGKTLEEAVRAAFGHDEYTGCGVQVELLHPPGVPQRRRR